MSKQPVAAASPIDGIPACPVSLKGDAKAAWEELAPLLASAGTITLLDRHALQRYCVVYARLERANKKIGASEVKKGGQRGGEFQTPWLFVANKCIEQLERLDDRLGLGRLARKRMGAEPAQGGKQTIPVRDRMKGPPPPVAGKIG